MANSLSIKPAPYIGRFAPTPSGPLHFGSLIAALGSYLQARSQQGQWRLRIDDIDPPREQPGAADDILRTLERYGLYWDGEVVYQSQRYAAYENALERLHQQNLLYPCGCSRKEIQQAGRDGPFGWIYPGTCRNGLAHDRSSLAIRIRTDERTIRFDDAVQGPQQVGLAQDIGDYVLKRADGLWAYQIAVVVDDAEAGVSEVVRGADLLDSTPRQIYLQQCLGLSTPHYAHLPVATHHGQKLSKQNLAPAITRDIAAPLLNRALVFLGQDAVTPDKPEFMLAEALAHWRLETVPRQAAIALD